MAVGAAGIALLFLSLVQSNALDRWPIGHLDTLYVWRTVDTLSCIAVCVFLIAAGLYLLRGRPAIGGSTPAIAAVIAIDLHYGLLWAGYQNAYSFPLFAEWQVLTGALLIALLLGACIVCKPKEPRPLLRPGVNSGAAGILMVGLGIVEVFSPASPMNFDQTLAWDVVYTYYRFGELGGGYQIYYVLDILAVALSGLAQAVLGAMLVVGNARVWRWAIALALLLCWINLRVIGTAQDVLLAAAFGAGQVAIIIMLWLGRPTPWQPIVPEYNPLAQPFEPVAPSIDTGDGWRLALLKSLSDTGVAGRRQSLLKRIVLWGALILVSGAAALFRSFALPQLLVGVHWTRAWTILSIWTVISMFFVFGVIAILGRTLSAMKAKGAAAELAKPDARRPILFLRSFDIDEATAQPSLPELLGITNVVATPEQKLVKALAKSGPVLAIGRPGEKLPPLGAARFYVTDALWRQKIADIASVSQLVVVTSGVTAGLAWEIRHIMASVSPRRLVLWAHPHLLKWRRKAREAEWSLFTDTLGQLFRHPFPRPLGDTELFTFGIDFRPQRVEPDMSPIRRLGVPIFGAIVPSAKEVLKRQEKASAELP